MLNEALQLARLGFCVFPLITGKKIPHKDSLGLKDATKNEDEIRMLWRRYGLNSNIAIALGEKSGIVAVDCDLNHGFQECDLSKFPPTVTVRTKNGFHLYYKHRQGIPKKDLLLQDKKTNDGPAFFRFDNCYNVAPPSIVYHETGQWEYKYRENESGELSFFESEIAECPDWFFQNTDDKTQNAPAVVSEAPPTEPAGETGKYPPGKRHNILVATAVAMRRKGKSDDEISKRLKERNLKDFTVSKDKIDDEITKIILWANKTIQQEDIFSKDEKIFCLGYQGDVYFYTSTQNKFITKISATSMKQGALLSLQPLEWWAYKYPTEKGGVDWSQAISDLMDACRMKGPFSITEARGSGAWEEQGRLILNLGQVLIIDDKEEDIQSDKIKKIYTYSKKINPPTPGILSPRDGKNLIAACEAANWYNKKSGIFLAGWLFISPIAGALKWRPHIWITGKSASGKTTLFEYIIKPYLNGFSHQVMGMTSAAGLRQFIQADSVPVVFEEIETSDETSQKRTALVIELARMASSKTDGVIIKGTVDQKGAAYKINNCFCAASININLTLEQDINRWSVLELEYHNDKNWDTAREAYEKITPELGSRCFYRAVKLFNQIQETAELFENLIAPTHGRRRGQQEGILLAGYWHLNHEIKPSGAQAEFLWDQVKSSEPNAKIDLEDDAALCIKWLCDSVVRTELPCLPGSEINIAHSVTMHELISKATVDPESYNPVLMRYGMFLDVPNGLLVVSRGNPQMQLVFLKSRWAGTYIQTMQRVDKAQRDFRGRCLGRRTRGVGIPVTAVLT